MIKSELNIGKVLRPRGIKGEMKIETYTSDPQRFQNLDAVIICGNEYAVKKIYLEGFFAYLQLDGIDTIEQVEKLRNKMVFVHRSSLPAPTDGKYYIVDLIGSDIIVGDKKLGELKDILQYGSADVYVTKTENGDVSFPALKKLIKSVDIQKGEIILDKEVFDEVAVFDNDDEDEI